MKLKLDTIIPRHIPPKSIEGGDDHIFAAPNGLEIDVYRLVHLTKDSPITEISTQELSRWLQEESWGDKTISLSPIQVLKTYQESGYDLDNMAGQPPELIRHLRKIIHSDLSHPIITFRGRILDGLHRLAKASLLEHGTIQAKVLDSIPKEAILKGHEEDVETYFTD